MAGVLPDRLSIAPRKVTGSKPVWSRQTSRLSRYSASPVSSNPDLMAESTESSFMIEMREMMMNLTRQMSTLTEKVTRLEGQANERSSTSKDLAVQNPPTGVHIPVRSMQVPAFDYDEEQYAEENLPPSPARAGKEKELSEKVDQLALELLNLKNYNPRKIDMSEFSIFPGVTLPPKFKIPDFAKYDGSGSPRSHLKMYINALEQYAYTKTWEDIVEKFIEQFSYDDGVEVTRRDLKMLKQQIHEPFSTFVKKWRRKAAQMTNRPSEEDQLSIIVKNLSSPYAQYMATQYYPDFKHFIHTGNMTEDALAQGVVLKHYVNLKEGKRPITAPKEVNQLGTSRPPPRNIVMGGEKPVQRPKKEFTPLPYTPSSIMRNLVRDGVIELLPPRPPPDPLPRGFREDQFCQYHQGPGHHTDRCIALRYRIKKLLAVGDLVLPEPNVTRNPLPKHTAPPPPEIGAISDDKPFVDPTSLICAITPATPYVLNFEEEEEECLAEPVINRTARIPYLFQPNEEDQVIYPCVYQNVESTVHQVARTPYVFQPDEEDQEARIPYVFQPDEGDHEVRPYVFQPDEEDLEIVCDEVCHVTRGGRVFKPAELRVENPAEFARASELFKSKSDEEDENLLWQLKKTQANILIWGLLMNSAKHREVILRELNAAKVSVDITPDQLVGLVAMARVSKTLSFIDEDLTLEGRNHSRPLRVTVFCNEKKVPEVLVDNGSALNVCPLSTATALGFEPGEFIPSEQGILAYDGTRRDVVGTLATEIQIGGGMFEIEFQVLDIKPSFNLLLGRPWLHKYGVVPSSLHQKLKFIKGNRVVMVRGDPDLEVGQISQELIIPAALEKNEDVSLTGFSLEVTAISVEEAMNEPLTFLTSSNPAVVRMMRKQGYVPGAGLGRHHQGVVEWPNMGKAIGLFGLGYEPTNEEISEMKKYMRRKVELRRLGIDEPSRFYSLLRSGHYRKEGEDFAFCGFAEPWVDTITHEKLPGFEIFFEMELPDEFPSLQINEKESESDWADLMEPYLLESLFKIDSPVVAMIEEDAPLLNPQAMITSAEGDLTNWSSYVFPQVVMEYDDILVNKSSNVMESGYESESVDVSEVEFELSDVATVKPESTDGTDAESVSSLIESDVEPESGASEDVLAVSNEMNISSQYVSVSAPLFDEFNNNNNNNNKEPSSDEDADETPLEIKYMIKQGEERRAKPLEEEIETINIGDGTETRKIRIGKTLSPEEREELTELLREFKEASPKDDFPLPHIDILVDNTAGHALLSFMDGFSGYNQIKMAPEDMIKTAFITEWGIYCYKVMPFGLKNAGATYQIAATTLLHDMMHKEVEVYVDDMIVKAKTREEHVGSLRKLFKCIQKYQLRLNPNKCVFGVTSGKLLGFLVSQRGIEVDPQKIKAIQEMTPPKTEKQIRGFLGKVQYLRRFIAQLTTICEPIFKLLKKNASKKWDEECQQAFEKIKLCLTSPPVLSPITPGQPLLLYLSVTDTAMGCMLAQQDPESKR
ncbi:uncharacterized protein LOC143882962 [Tasmannia lanceolata]|uniref:uncharacterized protein LOC143882962 n=1 Tax=Tasmannia lanceolata TaxID=3420 RepID=UPI00406429F3